MTLNTSLKGRLRNTNLPKSYTTINEQPDLAIEINGFIIEKIKEDEEEILEDTGIN